MGGKSVDRSQSSKLIKYLADLEENPKYKAMMLKETAYRQWTEALRLIHAKNDLVVDLGLLPLNIEDEDSLRLALRTKGLDIDKHGVSEITKRLFRLHLSNQPKALLRAHPDGAIKQVQLTHKQRQILIALNGKVLGLKELAALLDCDKSRLQRDHLKGLMDLDKVKNDRKVGGYYRPDAPPMGT